jgi:lipopolysaccharide heptosyltransferase I
LLYPADRILIVRTSALGDVIRAAPALVSLRRAYADAQIDWLVADAFAPAIQFHPDLSSVIPFPQGALKAVLRRGYFSDVLQWADRELTSRRYDLVIDFQGLLKSALLAFATRAPVRVGFADAREGATLFYTHKVSVEGGRGAPHVDRNFAVLRAIGVEPVFDPRVFPAPLGTEASRDPQLAGERYVLLSPTTKGQGRAWPMERYAALAGHLLDQRERLNIDSVVVVGLASEREQCAALLEVDGITDRVGATTIPSLIQLIADAALVVCNDSAAMHMTVALDRPLVALFGPTDVIHAGPYRRPQDVIGHKRPDEHVRHRDVARASEFMRRISLEEVIAACEERLTRSSAQTRA